MLGGRAKLGRESDTCNTYSKYIEFLYPFGLISINKVVTFNKLRVQ
jgi:hypothetical protein